jgi:hypothetical protein
MIAPHKKLLLWSLGGVLLVIANLVVAVHRIGTRAGTTYRWVCSETGAILSYNPGAFGSERLRPGGRPPVRGDYWELVEPEPLSPLLPWNWLALLADGPTPDPDLVLSKVH